MNDEMIFYVSKRHVVIVILIIIFLLLPKMVDSVAGDTRYNFDAIAFDMDDPYTIDAIDKWDEHGCSFFYKGIEQEAFSEYEQIIGDRRLMPAIKETMRWSESCENYSDCEIESALNAIVYGCNDREHSSGDYKSVADIPVPLFRICSYEISDFNDLDLDIETVYYYYITDLKKADA